MQAEGAFIQINSHLVSILADFQVDGHTQDDAATHLQRDRGDLNYKKVQEASLEST